MPIVTLEILNENYTPYSSPGLAWAPTRRGLRSDQRVARASGLTQSGPLEPWVAAWAAASQLATLSVLVGDGLEMHLLRRLSVELADAHDVPGGG